MGSRRIALFSDVHGNLEALEAVLCDMEKMGVQEKFCLGDVVGYGPDPAQCLELVRETGCRMLLGNHEEACVAVEPDSSFNSLARAGLDYARMQLSAGQMDFLRALPMKIDGEGFTVVHASLHDKEPWAYVFDARDAAVHFKFQHQSVCFCGHTHKPGIWKFFGGKVHSQPVAPLFNIDPGAQYLINVGSVGRTRTLKPEAWYALYDPPSRTIKYRFIPYAFQITQKKIIRAGLPRILAERLNLGHPLISL